MFKATEKTGIMVKLYTCVQKVLGSNIGWNSGFMNVFFFVFFLSAFRIGYP
jgi:hypothetical protein